MPGPDDARQAVDSTAVPAEAGDAGGDPACWAHVVCPECGAVTTEGHRPGCELAGLLSDG